MKLNLASGQHPTTLAGWVDVDLPWDGVTSPDVYGDAFALPFKDDAFERAYLGHFLEHVWWSDLKDLGAKLRQVLAPSAALMVVGPALDRAIADGQPDWLIDAIIGAGEGPGAHKWIPTEELHVIALEQMGFTDVRVLDVRDIKPPVWPNPVPDAVWQCAIAATAA